jgi:putative ABC transport system permease protein
MLKKIRSVWRAAVHRSAFEDGMDAEMRFHLDSRTADLIARGMAPDAARRRARLEFGPIEKQKDLARASRGLRLLDEIQADLRYTLRTLARNKGFTAAAVVTLALGIGANAAIFTLIDALMLRWLPVHRPQELLQLTFGSPGETPSDSFSYPLVTALDAQRDVFHGVAGFTGFPLTTGTGTAMTRVPAAIVTGGYYETLGIAPAAGRLLTRADDTPGAPLVAVASDGYWARHYARSHAAIGQSVLVNGVPVVLVGVSPRGFAGANVGAVADLTIPVAALPRLQPELAQLPGPGNFWLRVLTRLQPGVTESEARARLAVAWPRIAEASIAPHWPASRQQAIIKAVPGFMPGGTGWTYLREMYVKPLQVLMGVVALVLLIACANVASLLLARASARRRELAIRLAIGAGRGRIVRQLLVESATLSLIGAAAGIALATLGGNVLVHIISTGPAAMVFDLTPNWHVVAFTTLVAVATTLLFGLAPAIQSTAAGPAPALKDDARTGASRSRLLPALVTAQLALSLILLIAAGLFVRTLRNLQTMDPGFRSDGVLIADLGARQAIPGTLLEDVRRIPGVVSASVSTHTPLSGSLWSEPAVPAGQPIPERDTALFVGAGPDFFSTLGVPLVAGREFTGRDTRATTAVAIVNQRYAERFLANRNPIGQHLAAVVRGERRDLEIIGVAGNTNAASLRRSPAATVYVPYAQLTGDVPSTIEARVAGAAGTLPSAADAMRQLLQPSLPNAPVEVRPLSSQVAATIVQERMMATLGGAFGVLALVLASVGVYGLLAYGVARRTREIGIRMALGAQRRGVMALVIAAALRPLVLGVAIGLPAAWAASRWIESLLFGVKATDPMAIAAATIVLLAVAHAAAWIPARRAARIDPLVSLRSE